MCGWYFYLKHILRLKTPPSIWTHYGTLVHKYIQLVLMGEMEPELAAKKFIRTWFRFCSLYKEGLQRNYEDMEFKLPKGVTSPTELYRNPVRAIMEIKSFLFKKFGKYKVLCVEERLKEPTEYPQYFGRRS